MAAQTNGAGHVGDRRALQLQADANAAPDNKFVGGAVAAAAFVDRAPPSPSAFAGATTISSAAGDVPCVLWLLWLLWMLWLLLLVLWRC